MSTPLSSSSPAFSDSGLHLFLDRLPAGSRVEVETASREYHIEVLEDHAILISGHPEYCPEPIRTRVHGCIGSEGVLEPGHLGRGKRLMFMAGGSRPVTTSRILNFRVSH